MKRPCKRIAARTTIYMGLTMALTGLLAGCSVGNGASGAPAARTPQSHAARCTRSSCVSRDKRTAVEIPTWIMARDVRVLRRDSYTVDQHLTAIMQDATVLVIFHSVCTGSADGHCQSIDVFRNQEQKPIWHKQYVGVLQLRARPAGFTVKAVSYGPQDPLCCPTLPPVSDTYIWTGHGLRESGPLPGAPSG